MISLKKIVRISEVILLILLVYGCKKDKPPAIITTEVTDISQTTATSGGNVTDEGSWRVIARGICWSTVQNPAISDNRTSDSTGAGNYTSSLTDLIPGTNYYIRAYATNDAGTGYGNQRSFATNQIAVPVLTTTAITSITLTTAVSGGNITTDNGGSVIAKGVCWDTIQNPTTTDSKTSDGSETGSFTSAITGLTGNTTYYVRAYATNSAGTQYGNQISFTTSPLMPSLKTVAVFSITASYCQSGGNISSDGGAAVSNRGVCWNMIGNPSTSDNKTSDGAGTGGYISTITGLAPNSSYYVRAYATNSTGTGYGTIMSFTTLGQAPSASIDGATNITSVSATMNGFVNANNLSTTVTFEYGTTQNFGSTIAATPGTITGNTKTNVSVNVSGLTVSTTYYYRIKAVNSLGTTLSNYITFATGFYDGDGNLYSFTTIGNQVWMTENLKTTKYNDGTAIPLVTDGNAWAALYTPGYCWYANDAASYKVPYGALYNWYAVNTGKLCPSGWHVPTDAEWTTLITYVGGESNAGDKLKSNSYWAFQHTGTTNEFGFNALPGCKRFPDGMFVGKNTAITWDGNWWSTTEFDISNVYGRYMTTDRSEVFKTFFGKKSGLSVRCVKD